VIIRGLFTTVRFGNNLSVHEWINFGNVVHIYNGILLSLKKEGNPVICDYTDGP